MRASRNSPSPTAIDSPGLLGHGHRSRGDVTPSSPSYTSSSNNTPARIGANGCTGACCNDSISFGYPEKNSRSEALVDHTNDGDETGCACCRDHDDHEPQQTSDEGVEDCVQTMDVKWQPGAEDSIVLKETDITVTSSSHLQLSSISTTYTYCTWNNKVDLSCPARKPVASHPPCSKKPSTGSPRVDLAVAEELRKCGASDDQQRVKEYYNMLQYVLYEAGLPETRDRTKKPRHVSTGSDSVCIVVLASPASCMSILLEGGTQSPSNMLLVLSTAWLSKSQSERGDPLYSLHVHKAITFKDGGRSYLDIFEPPRRVTYFVNHMVRSTATPLQRLQVEEMETGLECPLSSSHRLSRLVDNKLWTRIKLAECGIGYPETLAFAYRSSAIYETKLHTVFIVHLLTKEGVEAVVRDEVERFVALPVLESNDKVVVKPSGVSWHGGRGLTFHSRSDVDAITSAIVSLLDEIDEENVILVEAFYRTTFPGLTCDELEQAATSQLALRLHSTVCRSPDNVPIMTKLVASIGREDAALTSLNVMPQCFDSALLSFGLEDESERRHLQELVREGSENLLKAVIDYETGLTAEERGGISAQTDIIEIDFVLSDVNNLTTPLAISVSGHDGATLCQMHEFMNPETRGDAFRPFIRTMIARSQRFFMYGKKVLVIGAGAGSLAWQLMENASEEYGIETILIDVNSPDSSEDRSFIQYNFSDHSNDDVHTAVIFDIVVSRSLRIDGCLTFDSKCLPLVAAICQRLNLIGPGSMAADVMLHRSLTMDVLLAQTSTLPHEPRTSVYATVTYRVNSKKDIASASIKMSYPFVIKREMSPSLATVVYDAPSAYAAFDHLCCNAGNNSSGAEDDTEVKSSSAAAESNVIIMPYISGTEHMVIIVLYHRCLIASYVIDIAQGRSGGAAGALPSFLPTDRVAQLRTAARQICVSLGLTDGIFHVRLRMSAVGPKLIGVDQGEVGDFFARDWIRVAYSVDLLLARLMIQCGVRPVLPMPRPGRRPVYIVGVNVPSSVRPPKFKGLAEVLEIHGAIRINRLQDAEDDRGMYVDSSGRSIWCNVAVADSDAETAENRLIEYTTLLGIASTEFDVPLLLRRIHHGDSLDVDVSIES